ncbi:hypothetical protein ACFXBB_30010 [Streptomyces scopuliridis]
MADEDERVRLVAEPGQFLGGLVGPDEQRAVGELEAVDASA